ncbi:MAG TPA: [protein-PII] uridylyltransferase [Acidimicrobiales bacterium]|nr:[protein-PII] uridylyltransferase [Acidimicrobiales bacterium]
MPLERGPLLADDALSGAAWCSAHARLVDAWLCELFEQANPAPTGMGLVAIGGYGRAELCPGSDIDLMFVHDGRAGASSVAERIWYPIWDEGLHLGHSLTTVRDALRLAADDLDTATALLSARHVAGDPSLSAALAQGGERQWTKRSRRWLEQLADRVDARHLAAGEVAFRLEPDLKEGRGGLRDVHSLRWAEAAHGILLEHDDLTISAAYAVLLSVRVELQRGARRPTNHLTLQEQDAVAARLGLPDADVLMSNVAQAARTIAWTSDDTWRRVRSGLRGPAGRLARRVREVADGVVIVDGEAALASDAGCDPTLALRLAVAAARHAGSVERQSLERLATEAPPLPDPWPSEARTLFAELLLTGAPAVSVIEAFDQRGIWARILPEWDPVRSRPQRNAYHRFTVDRHLLETAANAAALAGRVARADLLVIAALLHDLGKGYPGDHSEVGVELITTVGGRMGYPADDIETLGSLVAHHLLLADVATRRDLDDPATVDRVAAAVGTVDRLNLLAALTEADSLATGPSAWGPAKAQLVSRLVTLAAHVLGGGDSAALPTPAFPNAQQRALLAAGGQHIDGRDEVLTVVTDDHPGVFSRVAGVVALHGLDVVAASAYSSDDGRALAEFRVSDPFRSVTPWPRIVVDLEAALEGRLALDARVAERAHTYGRGTARLRPQPATVSFHADASAVATVIDVEATDGVGVLYRITRALAEFDLDIRSAKVQTLGGRVVDAFYVRDRSGAKITDPALLTEIERAIVHSLDP